MRPADEGAGHARTVPRRSGGEVRIIGPHVLVGCRATVAAASALLFLTSCSPTPKDVEVGNPCPTTVRVRVWDSELPKEGKNYKDALIASGAIATVDEAVTVIGSPRNFWSLEMLEPTIEEGSYRFHESLRRVTIPAAACGK